MLLNYPESADLAQRIASGTAPIAAEFYAPLLDGLDSLESHRVCPDLPDEDWLCLGVLRTLHEVPSGRAFLQQVAASCTAKPPEVTQFFQALRSPRRLALIQEAHRKLVSALKRTLPDRFASESELAGFDIYAGDGHWHGAASHDARDEAGNLLPCGHFYALDLRSHCLHHLDAADQVHRKQEHDMRALKRQNVERLRLGAGKGRKVLYAYDPAGIDFRQWDEWKRSGIYFLSLEKENMRLTSERSLEWDKSDPRNCGMVADEVCTTSHGTRIRRITWMDSATHRLMVFITNEMTLPPGLLTEIYRRRWEIEKVFDEIKNKLGEKKAWATTATAKKMQAIFICLTHQLLLAFEGNIAKEDGVAPIREIERRKLRAQEERKAAESIGLKLSPLRAAQGLTQRTVKFIRWLRAFLWTQAPWATLIARLRHSYASS